MQFAHDICRIQAEIAAQGEKVRLLKKAQHDKETLGKEVEALVKLKQDLQIKEKAAEDAKPSYVKCRQQLENLMKRRFLVAPAFEVYGGAAGLFDFGPAGCAIKCNVEALWREHFVLYEDMLEVSCTCLTPHEVLQASGHVDRFCDLMVRDTVTGECLRADKHLEEWIGGRIGEVTDKNDAEALLRIQRQADALSAEEIHQFFQENRIKSPAGNDLSEPFPFNLMFKSRIGPKEAEDGSGTGVAYLRPETAQGIFLCFRRLYEQNSSRLPFAAAQIGLGFRNEIAPRNGLLRVREFQMAEIEYFLDPIDKTHPRFADVASLMLPLFPAERQISDGVVLRNMTVREAVEKKLIANESLAYFISRTYLFLRKCGIQEQGLRFRQHLPSEMAHYACDCWDAEIETSYGWVECAGHADRSAYDLTAHSRATGVDMNASRKLNPPRIEKQARMQLNKGALGPRFKKDAGAVIAYLESLSTAERMSHESTLAEKGSMEMSTSGKSLTLTRDLVSFSLVDVKVHEDFFTPAVIEPSFGIGRIVQAALEHTFRSRGIEDQEERNFLALPPAIAPFKCSLLSISSNKEFEEPLSRMKADLTRHGVSCKVDCTTASIGKRYARTDEIGIPFGITVDFQTLGDSTVTVRERDSMQQVRVPVANVPKLIRDLCEDRLSWKEVAENYPIFVEQNISK